MKMVAAILALGVVMAPSVNAEKPVHIAGIYSDLRYNEEGGDLLGTEIFIVLAAGKYTAFVQGAEGEPGVAVVVPVTVEKDRVSFTVPKPSHAEGTYDGRVSANAFEGTATVSENGKTYPRHFRLPRKKSYWQ